MMNASYQYQVTKEAFWKLFFPGLTGVIGFWATLSLNIMDFTRYAKSQVMVSVEWSLNFQRKIKL